MKKIIVFGGSGFLGSHVADKLSNSGYNVSIFDKIESKFLLNTQKMIKGNILNTDEEVRSLFYLPEQLQVRRDKNGDIDQVMPPWFPTVQHHYV